jgi:serine/threonine protein kinase HipA of HipAB toxin-antitoxin module
VAEGGERKHFADACAARDVVRGHRLEKADAHLRSADGSVRITQLIYTR